MYGPQLPTNAPGKNRKSPVTSKQAVPITASRPLDVAGPQRPIPIRPAAPSSAEPKALISKQPSKKIYGAQLPPHMMVDRNDDHSASSGDDVFGPLPSKITPEEQDEIDRVRKINEINGRQIGTKMHSTAVAREDWMLTPPEALRAGGMQSRKFSQKGVGNTQDNSDWTSAPGAERAANANARPKSLVEMHANKESSTKVMPAAKSVFNRERDIGGQRIDGNAVQKTLREAKDLDSKFSKKTYL